MSYKSLEDLERVISLGKPEKVIDVFLESYMQGLELEAWTEAQEAEHKTLYPELIPNPDYVAEVPAVGEEWIDNLDGTFTANPDYIPAVPAVGDETIPNPDLISFDDWMKETVVTQVAQDAIYDENNILVTPAVAEVTALEREFVEVDVSAKAMQWKLSNYSMQRLSDAVQKHLDTKAQEFRYDHMNSARSYAGYTNAFQAEALSLGAWASECWVYAGQVEADFIAGLRTMPTADELIAELPKYVGI